ncbi:MAG: SDR family NAD(P)-dependent oxidoreductase [Dermatophilaceae bacterium]
MRANRGLGLAIGAALARQGIHVVLTGRDPQATSRAAAGLAIEGLPVSSHQLDITDTASVARAFADVANEHGRLDILINNAGIAIDRRQPAASADMERVAATLDTNLLGAWRCSTAAVQEMRRNRYGRIVNVTSHLATAAEMGAGNVSYRVAKAGLNALTRILADELKDDNILVNAASPGRIATRMAYGETTATPESAAETYTWLATLLDNGPTGQLFHDRSPLSW